MTAPITFPDIGRSPQVIQDRGALEGAGEFLLTMLNSRKQLALERARLDLERQRTDSAGLTDKAQRDKLKREQNLAEQTLAGAEAAEPFINEATLALASTPLESDGSTFM